MKSFKNSTSSSNCLLRVINQNARYDWSRRTSSPTARIRSCLLLVLLTLTINSPVMISAAVAESRDELVTSRVGPAEIPENQAEYEALQTEGAVNPASQFLDPTRSPGQLSPMAVEMLQVLQQEQDGLRRLQIRFQQAGDPQAALAIQREIESLKVDTELELLRIQADYARREGRLATAEKIENAIEQILHPAIPEAPVDHSLSRNPRGEPAGQGEE